MSENNKDNIVEMPKGNEDKATDPVEMTDEQVKAKQEEAKAEAEKSRLVHLEHLRMNPFVLRDTFQKQIFDGLATDSNKVKALCEVYSQWAGVMQDGYDASIDTDEVSKQVAPIIEKCRQAIEKNSLAVSALFLKKIQDYVIKADTSKIKALNEALSCWNTAEFFSNSFA